jgi:hypothetical protein
VTRSRALRAGNDRETVLCAFDRDGPTEARVSRRVALAHAAGADQREDLVRAEPFTWRQGHGGTLDYMWQSGGVHSYIDHSSVYTLNNPETAVPPNNSMQLTALRAAADAER